MQRESTGELVHNGTVIGGETYTIVLRPSTAADTQPRYYYAVVIDSHGKSQLVFPRAGSVENRFAPGEREIPLGNASAFKVTPPYGVDTYVLLSTDEPLPNPKILEWTGMRARVLPNQWSLECVAFRSVPPRR